MQTALLLDPLYKKHETGAGHPERADRYDAVTHALEQADLLDRMPRVKPREATDDELALVHARQYIGLVRREIPSGAGQLSTGDTDVCKDTLEVALKAVGGVLNAVDKVFGAALQAGRSPADLILLVTGRISGELAFKAARAGVAAVATPSVPSTIAVDIARAAGILLIGRAVSGAPQLHLPSQPR